MSPTAISGVIGAVMIALLGLQTWRLGNAQEEIGELRETVKFQVAETETAVAVNAEQTNNIDKLIGRVADMVETRRLDREERDRVLAARDEDLAAAITEARRLEGERNEIFRSNNTCREMGDIRVDFACPAIAERLRERTDSEGGDQNRISGS